MLYYIELIGYGPRHTFTTKILVQSAEGDNINKTNIQLMCEKVFFKNICNKNAKKKL